MDHSHHAMDHSGMDHGHGGHDMGPMCNMNVSTKKLPQSLTCSSLADLKLLALQMLFTWNTEDLCIVFEWWHIRSTFGLVASLLAVVALVAGYEAVREGIRRYEAWVNKRAETAPRKFSIVYIHRASPPLSKYILHISHPIHVTSILLRRPCPLLSAYLSGCE